jgi:hypothetical protein
MSPDAENDILGGSEKINNVQVAQKFLPHRQAPLPAMNHGCPRFPCGWRTHFPFTAAQP